MAEVKSDRKQALELAISTIERQFGKGSVMRLGAGGPLEEIAVIPTGALSLDVALGVGGVPRGRVVEIYGPESSGKTTLALHIVSEAQRLGGTGAFIDAEHALDPIYARKLVVFINQIREKIGVMFGSPETTTGGRALKFYASVRLDIRRQDAIKIGTESVGVRTKVKVVKNKLAPPFREAEFDVMYGEGISKSGTVLDAGVEQGIIEKSGTWYSYKNERIGQGRDNARKWLQENATVLVDLEAKIREALGLRAPAPLKS